MNTSSGIREVSWVKEVFDLLTTTMACETFKRVIINRLNKY